jgi:hypothetical protein
MTRAQIHDASPAVHYTCVIWARISLTALPNGPFRMKPQASARGLSRVKPHFELAKNPKKHLT